MERFVFALLHRAPFHSMTTSHSLGRRRNRSLTGWVMHSASESHSPSGQIQGFHQAFGPLGQRGIEIRVDLVRVHDEGAKRRSPLRAAPALEHGNSIAAPLSQHMDLDPHLPDLRTQFMESLHYSRLFCLDHPDLSRWSLKHEKVNRHSPLSCVTSCRPSNGAPFSETGP